MAKEVRGPVEQMLSVVLPGFEPTGRPHHRPAVRRVVPGFFDYLVEERGLRPASVRHYRHHLDRFEAYLGGSASSRSRELSPAILSAFIVERAGRGAGQEHGPRQRLGCCGCSCATPTGKASSPAI